MADVTYASAYHNYLVGGRLCKDMTVGSPNDAEGFFLTAHEVSPGEPMPLLSGRFFDKNGDFLLLLEKNKLVENPNGFSFLETRGGWALMDSSMETLLSAEVRMFENSHITVLRGALRDSTGKLVVHGDNQGLHLLAKAGVL
jgi:hypothetical protein